MNGFRAEQLAMLNPPPIERQAYNNLDPLARAQVDRDFGWFMLIGELQKFLTMLASDEPFEFETLGAFMAQMEE